MAEPPSKKSRAFEWGYDYSATHLTLSDEENNDQPSVASDSVIPSPSAVKTGFYNPLISGCRSSSIFEVTNIISSGTYGAVYRARRQPGVPRCIFANPQTSDDEFVALKLVKYHERLWSEGLPVTTLREISALIHLRHPHLVAVEEVVTGKKGSEIYVVMEYVPHELRLLLQEGRPEFSDSERKRLVLQLLEAVAYLHDRLVLHRDLKTNNLLYNNVGVLKICDFGMARKFSRPHKPYTANVVTLWYRAPEMLLGERNYTEAADMWSVGCIFAEILLGEALFAGETEIQMLDKIFALCGTPNEKNWPDFRKLPVVAKHKMEFTERPSQFRQKFPLAGPLFCQKAALSDCGLDLLQHLLALDPNQRISAADAVQHPWFQERPWPQRMSMMPTAPESNNTSRATRQREKELRVLEPAVSGVLGESVDTEHYLSMLKGA